MQNRLDARGILSHPWFTQPLPENVFSPHATGLSARIARYQAKYRKKLKTSMLGTLFVTALRTMSTASSLRRYAPFLACGALLALVPWLDACIFLFALHCVVARNGGCAPVRSALFVRSRCHQFRLLSVFLRSPSPPLVPTALPAPAVRLLEPLAATAVSYAVLRLVRVAMLLPAMASTTTAPTAPAAPARWAPPPQASCTALSVSHRARPSPSPAP